MIRTSIDSVEALSPLVRVVRADQFDLLMDELRALRQIERGQWDLAYEERAAVVAWLRREIEKCGCDDDTASCIERGEHREVKP